LLYVYTDDALRHSDPSAEFYSGEGEESMIIKKEDIKNIRERLKMTQEEFARRIGVTVTTVSRWERGDCLPKSRVVIEKIGKLKK